MQQIGDGSDSTLVQLNNDKQNLESQNISNKDTTLLQTVVQLNNDKEHFQSQNINNKELPESVQTAGNIQRKRKDVSIQTLDILQKRQKTIPLSSSNNALPSNITEDDDTKFLLSFRSYMKNMNTEQKIDFQMGMLQLVKKISMGKCPTSSSSQSTCIPAPQNLSSYEGISTPPLVFRQSLNENKYDQPSSPDNFKSSSPEYLVPEYDIGNVKDNETA